jgi:hypothetical protein
VPNPYQPIVRPPTGRGGGPGGGTDQRWF